MAGEIKRRKIVLELEGLPYDPVERINPDGSVVMLPPQDAEDEVAAPFRAIFPRPPPDFPFKSPVPAPFRCITTRRSFTSLYHVHSFPPLAPGPSDLLFWRPPTLMAWHSV